MVYVLIEENYRTNNRAKLLLDGMLEVTRKKRIGVRVAESFRDLGEARVVVLLCASLKWATDTIEALVARGIHPLLFGFQYIDTMYQYSCISLTYTKSSYLVAKYVLGQRRAPVAFLGFNKDSMPDALKLKGVEYAAAEAGVPCTVFPNDGDILRCFCEFTARAAEFGNVICSNDSVAILFRSEYPALAQNLLLASCSGSLLGEYLSSPHATTRINYYKAGKQLAELYLFLEKQKTIYSTFMTLEMDVAVPSGEPAAAGGFTLSAKEVDFYGDPAIRAVEELENMLRRCDETDIAVLKRLVKGEPYEEIAEEENLAVNTVKYRVHAMLKNAELSSKKELIAATLRFGLDFS